MKHTTSLLLLALALVSLSFGSCDKPEITPMPFVGTYDIAVVTDSVGMDGQLYSAAYYHQITGKTEPDRFGTMTIASADGLHFDVEMEYVAPGSSSLFSCTTTATLDAENRLVIATCQDPNAQYATFTYTFPRAVEQTQPLVFRCEASTVLAGMDCRYLRMVTATLRERGNSE